MAIFRGPNIVRTGLVLALDAADKNSYKGSGTAWNDISGNANTGTLTNGPTFSGLNGGCIVFDGTDDYSSRASITNPPTTTFTISLWCTFLSNTADRYLFSVGRDIGAPTGGLALLAYGFDVVSDVLIFELGSGVGRVSSGIVPTINTWYNIVATADGTNTKFYVNSILKNTSAQGSGQITSNPTLSVGSYVNGSGIPSTYFHDGRVSNVLLYNRALTATEVLQNYNATKTRFGL
jgi:hypothetical protein